MLAALIAVLRITAMAGESPLSSYGLYLAPKSESPAVSREIPGAKATVLTVAREASSGPKPVSAREWDAAGLQWPDVLAAGIARAKSLEQSMTIRWQRDSRKVYQYAVIESADPFISSVVFSPGFINHFKAFLGKEVLVVIPDRLTLFVFSRFDKVLDQVGPELVRRYEAAPNKVSLEVFLLAGGKGPQAIGKLGN